MAAEISAVTGRPLTFQSLPVHDYEAALVSAGLGEGDASGLAHIFKEALDGRNAHLESGIKDVLTREPRDFKAFAEDALVASAHHR